MSVPGTPPRPPSPTPEPADEVPRSPASRACDRCRRMKTKCDYLDDTRSGSCLRCRYGNASCTFDLPLVRRGPKRRAAQRPSPEAPVPARAPLPPISLARSSTGTPTGPAFGSGSVSARGSWEPPAAHLSISHVLSPPSPGPARVTSALIRWHALARAVALRNSTLERMANRCFDLFFDYLYPLTPLVHEPTLRDGLDFFLAQTAEPGRIEDAWPRPPAPGVPCRPAEKTWPEAMFTFITAVCAEVAFMLPKDLFPEGESVADVFLEASRDCLNHYLEADLESPNANSITIRYFHSNCVHAAGRPKYSWHIYGEAARLVQVMRLHDEASLDGLYPVEAELRRRAFWIVYMGDKSAAILNNRPMTMHKFCFDSGITTAYPTGIEDEPPSDSGRQALIHGFNANLRLWLAASDILLEIRLFQSQQAPADFVLTNEERQRLDSLYVHFITCLDSLPPYLQSYRLAPIASGGGQATQTTQFAIQCANLHVSYHCLRMVITQKFEDIAYFTPSAEQADLRKTEIVRDALRVTHDAPFWSLQVNGEPYVEKIRVIGASLLAVIHRNQASPLAARARSDFAVLLDILTRLNSKASDALRGDFTVHL